MAECAICRTHFDIGFQLDSIATMGRKVRERKGAWVSKNRMVEQCFDRCAVASLYTVQLREKVEWLGEGIMNHHGIKEQNWTACSTVPICRRYTRVINPCFPLQGIASLH